MLVPLNGTGIMVNLRLRTNEKEHPSSKYYLTGVLFNSSY